MMQSSFSLTGVIDVGSNSVRLALFKGDEPIFRRLITSRLGEGVESGRLSDKAIVRSVDAVSELVRHAFFLGAEQVYAFATEAVRRAENGGEFIQRVQDACGLKILLVKAEDEALLAVEGALNGSDGAVIDLGGASTEIAVCSEGKIIYAHSLPVGAVVLHDACGRNKNKLPPYIAQKTEEYGEIPQGFNVFAVGGTATSITACALGLKEYDANAVHMAKVSVEHLDSLIERFEVLSPKEIFSAYPVDERRAEIILGGAMLLRQAVKRLGASSFIASESDNLEGFIRLVRKGYFGDVPRLMQQK